MLKKYYKIFIFLPIILCLIIIIVSIFLLNKPFFRSESRFKEIKKAEKEKKYPVIGWIRVQGTNIDYYIMGESDDKKYPVEEEKYAWIDTNDNKYHNVLNIYGHNVMNLSATPLKKDDSFRRFEELVSFLYYDTVQENKYIQLTIDGKDYIYQIFAVGVGNDYYLYTFKTGEYDNDDKREYLKIIKDNSIYDFDIDVNEKDNFITLITCTRIFGRATDSIYVSGRLVNNRKNRYDNYSVKKNKNYKIIDEKLRGGGLDEEEA